MVHEHGTRWWASRRGQRARVGVRGAAGGYMRTTYTKLCLSFRFMAETGRLQEEAPRRQAAILAKPL